MGKSHLISLFILFVAVTVLIVSQAFTGKSGETILNAPTPTAYAPTVATAEPTELPSQETPVPQKVTRPEVDMTKFSDLDRKTVEWSLDSTLQDANDPESRVYSIPVGIRETLSAYDDYVYLKPSESEKTVYLTFNMAYENGVTAKILDILAEKQVKAIFFVSKEYITEPQNEDLLRRMLTEGHLIGSRGDIAGKGMSEKSAQDFCDTLWAMEERYQELAGDTERMLYYRPNAISPRDYELARAMGYTVVFRSYMYYDFDNTYGVTKALSNLIVKTSNGVIFQLSASEINANILKDYITQITQKGYVLKRIDQ